MRKTLPFEYRQEDISPLKLKHHVIQIIPKIEADLVGSLEWYAQNALYVRDSLDIISLEYLGSSRYKLNYSFRWNLYNPCLDIDSDQLINQSVNFTCEPGALVFDFIDNSRQTMSDEL